MFNNQRATLRPAPFSIDDPERIPAQRYFDEDFYKSELAHLWPRVWQMACRLEQIPEEGDWVEYSNVGKSVIIVNTGATGIKAYHNACRHRGVPIAGMPQMRDLSRTDHGNCKQSGFVCPFHGWRYDMHGENTFVYGRQLFTQRQLDHADLNLVSCRAETAAGAVWINFDEDAPPLRASMGPLLDRLEAHGMSELRVEWCYSTVLPANWKLAMEAFMEGYHLPHTHPQVRRELPGLYEALYASEGATGSSLESKSAQAPATTSLAEQVAAQIAHLGKLSEGMAGMVHAKELAIAEQLRHAAVSEDPEHGIMQWFGLLQQEITEQLRARGEPVPDLNAVAVTHPLHALEFLFPNYFLLPVFTSMAAYRIRPLGPESCYFEIYSLTMYPRGEEPEPVMGPTKLAYDSKDFPPIAQQDFANIPMQQVGLHAQGFEFMRLAAEVEGLISNFNRLLDGYLAGADPASLAEANRLLMGNFDGKIKDLGLTPA